MDTREQLEYIVANKDRIPGALWQEGITPHWTNNDPIPDEDKYVFLMDNYHVGDYCGRGERVVLDRNGKLWYGFTSHCSCYGPWDVGNGDTYEDDFKALSKNQTHDFSEGCKEEYKQFEMEVITLMDAFGEDLKNGVDLVYNCVNGNISAETCLNRISKQDENY